LRVQVRAAGPALGDGDTHVLDVALLAIGRAHLLDQRPLDELSIGASSVDPKRTYSQTVARHMGHASGATRTNAP
jgi:hypothetical protein